MVKNIFNLYHCIAKRSDNSTIERIFKIPSFWSIETLFIALVTTSDAPGLISKVSIKVDDYYAEFKFEERTFMSQFLFEEVESDELEVIIYYKDGLSLKYKCKKIGFDISKNRINRKTPVMISASGFSRMSHSEYCKVNKAKIMLGDPFYSLETMHLNFITKDITRLFSLYVSDFFYEEDYYK